MKKLLAALLTAVMLFSFAALAEADLREENLITLDVVMMASAGKDSSNEVVDAINAYLEEKLNINITLTFISYGNYAEQTNLMLSAGEGVDVLPVYLAPLSTVANNGQVLELNDLLMSTARGSSRRSAGITRTAAPSTARSTASRPAAIWRRPMALRCARTSATSTESITPASPRWSSCTTRW